jgi:hypothetical protein
MAKKEPTPATKPNPTLVKLAVKILAKLAEQCAANRRSLGVRES